jgi:hypothetical protein
VSSRPTVQKASGPARTVIYDRQMQILHQQRHYGFIEIEGGLEAFAFMVATPMFHESIAGLFALLT